MIWGIIWAAFTLFIIWLFARSMRTVMSQQKTWALFAQKHGLLYQKPLWYKAPSVEGTIKGRRVRIYVDEIVDPVRRLREFRTTTEVYLTGGLPTGIAIGSAAYHELLRGIENVEPVRLPTDLAFVGLVSLARDPAIYESWAEPRMEKLKEFFSQKRSERLIMGHENDGFIVLQSGETLEDIKTLNARMRLLFAYADAFDRVETVAEPEVLAIEAETSVQTPESASLPDQDMGGIVTVTDKDTQ